MQNRVLHSPEITNTIHSKHLTGHERFAKLTRLIWFQVCAIFQVSVDFGLCCYMSSLPAVLRGLRAAIVIQRFVYGTAPPLIPPDEEDILEETLRLEEEDAQTP